MAGTETVGRAWTPVGLFPPSESTRAVARVDKFADFTVVGRFHGRRNDYFFTLTGGAQAAATVTTD